MRLKSSGFGFAKPFPDKTQGQNQQVKQITAFLRQKVLIREPLVHPT
jgi:hypothetical protein